MTEASDLPGEQVAELSGNIFHSAQRLYRLIENYLAYALTEILQNDEARLVDVRNVVTTQPARLIEESILERADFHKRRGDLALNVADAAAVQIFDENLQKIVFELVDNAFKFSAAGTPVRVETEIHDHEYAIHVTNRGRGMTPAQIASIGAYVQFERKLYEQQGSGLGLTVAIRLVDLYNGRFNVESVPGKQTTVHVWLPLAKPE
jgi:two-component system sensor histidine kinase/response regulator